MPVMRMSARRSARTREPVVPERARMQCYMCERKHARMYTQMDLWKQCAQGDLRSVLGLTPFLL
eukprot:5026432-Alexandrium_andersonii.AAC.1